MTSKQHASVHVPSRLARAGKRAAFAAMSVAFSAVLPACVMDVEASSEFAEFDEENVASAEQALIPDASVNLARSRPTLQSSTTSDAGSERAVDGVTNGNFGGLSVTRTNFEAQPWWQVDLGAVQLLGTIVIHNRTDCCSDQLSNLKVLVSDDGINNWRIAAVHPGAASSKLELNLTDRTTGSPIRGRYVRVQLNGTNYLSLAEVQIYAPALVNLAYNKPATQSSTYHPYGAASHAVDGKTDGVWSNLSVTHTNDEDQPSLTVDLGSSQPIAGVVLWNRTDCCSDRLSNFRLMLSNDNSTWTSYNYPGTVGTSATFHLNATARFVSVQLNGRGILSLAELQVLGAIGSDRVRSVDLGGSTPGSTRYFEHWEDSSVMDDLLSTAHLHFKGDFMHRGHDQVLHLNRTVNGQSAQIIDYAGATKGGIVLSDDMGLSPSALNGWLDGEDRQFVGDFTGLGHPQIMYLNRGGSYGKIMITDYSSGLLQPQIKYYESWGDSAALDGWIDNNDIQLSGDFMGLGRSQIMYINRGGAYGKVMIVDYAGAAPGQVRYFENWGQSLQLEGWIDNNDLQFVGDFMGLGHSQVMFINRSGADGKVMILDYAGGVVPGVVRYWEIWGQTYQLAGWIDDGDKQVVGDFTGVGRDQLLLFNTKNEGNGKLQVLDFGGNTWPATQRYYQSWGQTGELSEWPTPGDILLPGKFSNSSRAELLTYHLGQSASFATTSSNPSNCPAAHLKTADGGCIHGCPAGQTLLDSRCVTLVPYSGTDLQDGARVVMSIHNRVKAQSTLSNLYNCSSAECIEPFGPAWLDTSYGASIYNYSPHFTANLGPLTRKNILTAEAFPSAEFPSAFSLRFPNGNYLLNSFNLAYQVQTGAAAGKAAFRWNDPVCPSGLAKIHQSSVNPYPTQVKPIIFADDTGRTIAGINNVSGGPGCTPIDTYVVE